MLMWRLWWLPRRQSSGSVRYLVAIVCASIVLVVLIRRNGRPWLCGMLMPLFSEGRPASHHIWIAETTVASACVLIDEAEHCDTTSEYRYTQKHNKQTHANVHSLHHLRQTSRHHELITPKHSSAVRFGMMSAAPDTDSAPSRKPARAVKRSINPEGPLKGDPALLGGVLSSSSGGDRSRRVPRRRPAPPGASSVFVNACVCAVCLRARVCVRERGFTHLFFRAQRQRVCPFV